MKPLQFMSVLAGSSMAGLAFVAGLILLKTTAWDIAEMRHRILTGALLLLSSAAGIAAFVHLLCESRLSGILFGVLLIALGAYPLATSFHYIFIGPSYGGMIGGVGAAIVFGQFLISLLATLSGIFIIFCAINTRK